MAYRPSPAEFPEGLAAIPPAERRMTRAANGIVLAAVGVAGLLVSAAHAREMVLGGEGRELWKPGLGALFSLLVAAMAIFEIARPACFVRRGDWLAIYKRGVRTKTVPVNNLVVILPRTFTTVKLSFSVFVMLMISGVGLPMYLSSTNAPRFVYVAWLIAAGLMGFAVGLDRIVAHTGKRVQVGGVDYYLRRLP